MHANLFIKMENALNCKYCAPVQVRALVAFRLLSVYCISRFLSLAVRWLEPPCRYTATRLMSS